MAGNMADLINGANILAAGAPAAPTIHRIHPSVDSEKLALHVTFYILGIFVLFALLTLPRLVVRFSRASEWSKGYFFYESKQGAHKAWKSKTISLPIQPSPTEKKYPGPVDYPASDDSHTLYSHTHLVRNKEAPARSLSLPSHLASWSGRYHRFSAFFSKQVLPDCSFGRSLLVLGYSAIVFWATIWKTNPLLDLQRSGFIAMTQLPIVFALGTKNNILGMIWAVGYEKINWLHRAVGIIFAIVGNLHAIGFVYLWALEGNWEVEIAKDENKWGLICLVALNVIVFFSTSTWRKKSYYIFVLAHVTGIILVPWALVLHKPATKPYVWATAGIYGLDRIMRLLKTRICKASLTTIPELGITRIDIPHLNAGWRAGQHVRIRVLTSGMGLLGRVDIHPFTIANMGTDGMTLMCKKAGDWTNNLYAAADRGDAAWSGGEGGTSKSARVIVEGPYGGPGHTMFDSFSGAMFVAGGSGITFALCAIQDLIQKDNAGRSRVKVIELVWSVQDAGSLMPMLPTFTSMIQQAAYTHLNISVYYTRASKGTTDPNKIYGYLPPNITILPGRPRFPGILDSVIDKSCAVFSSGFQSQVSDNLTGVIVGVCGPSALAHDLRRAIGGVDPRRYKAVGGVELCEEVFGW